MLVWRVFVIVVRSVEVAKTERLAGDIGVGIDGSEVQGDPEDTMCGNNVLRWMEKSRMSGTEDDEKQA